MLSAAVPVKIVKTVSMPLARQHGARAFIVCMALAASVCFTLGLRDWGSSDLVKFICYMAAALWPPPSKSVYPAGHYR